MTRYKTLLDDLQWERVRSHYDARVEARSRVSKLRADGKERDIAPALLGISEELANQSAREHSLGPRILSTNANAAHRVCELAARLSKVEDGAAAPDVIRAAALRFLKITVGTEIACILVPQHCWTTNVRTVWAHLLIEAGWNRQDANEALKPYSDGEADSEADYRKWSAAHRLVGPSMLRLVELSEPPAQAANVKPGRLTYLWADAISSELYAYFSG